MLSVTSTTSDFVTRYAWHVGKRWTIPDNISAEGLSLTIDGDELDYLRDHVATSPGRVVVAEGDVALAYLRVLASARLTRRGSPVESYEAGIQPPVHVDARAERVLARCLDEIDVAYSALHHDQRARSPEVRAGNVDYYAFVQGLAEVRKRLATLLYEGE